MLERICTLHTSEYAPDRAKIRDKLGSITDEVTETLCNTELRVKRDYCVEIGRYERYRAEHDDVYRRVLNELPAFELAEGRYDEYVTSDTDSRYGRPILTRPFIPIGEYGIEAASQLLVGTVRALSLAEERDAIIGKIATKSPTNQDLILNHTFHGHFTGDAQQGLATTSQVGIVSTAHAMALLSAERVEGFTWGELITTISKKGLISEFTRKIGSGLLPYLITMGRYIKPPLNGEGDSIQLSTGLQAITRINRTGFRTNAEYAEMILPTIAEDLEKAHLNGDPELSTQLERMYTSNHLTASAGTICPAAIRGGSVDKTAGLILALAPTC